MSEKCQEEKCQRKMWKQCDTCAKFWCSECASTSPNHKVCAECTQCLVCQDYIVCDWCIGIHPYHWITDRVAVGNRHAPYDFFDIIVNLNYPDNGVQFNDAKLEHVESKKNKRRKYVIKVGMFDSDLEEYKPFAARMFEHIHEWVNQLIERVNRRGHGYPRVLFHCAAGISRSVSAAVYHLSHSIQGMTPSASLALVKKKRKIANPNKGFLSVLGLE